jgi:hypothetical protein
MDLDVLFSAGTVFRNVPIDGKNPKNGAVHLSFCPADRFAELVQQATPKVTGRKRFREKPEPDHVLLSALLGGETVHGWSDLKVDGKDLPYTDDNRDFMMTKDMDFNEFVQDHVLSSQKLQELIKQGIIKKSSSTSVTGTTTPEYTAPSAEN